MRKAHHKTERQKEAMKIAKELCYGSKVIGMISNAKNDEEIQRILHDARIGKIN